MQLAPLRHGRFPDLTYQELLKKHCDDDELCDRTSNFQQTQLREFKDTDDDDDDAKTDVGWGTDKQQMKPTTHDFGSGLVPKLMVGTPYNLNAVGPYIV
jgi:hypothetical protein